MIRKILVADKEEALSGKLESYLRSYAYDVCFAVDRNDLPKLAYTYAPEIIIINVGVPHTLDAQLLTNLRADYPDCYVVLISAEADCRLAVECIKSHAYTLLSKPLQYPRLMEVLVSIERELDEKVQSGSKSARKRSSGMIGTSASMLEVHSLISTISKTDMPVLITGESGTGKDVAANAIHNQSDRSAAPLVVLNTSAIPSLLLESELFGYEKGAFTGAETRRAGCFEMADHGTLFLDEIADMPIGLQAKLLRVVEDQHVRRLGSDKELVLDVRILAATNRDPDRAVSEGELRRDLYHRLNVFGLTLPALRNRREDLPLLIAHFLAGLNERYKTHILGIKDDAMARMHAYSWPGNVRELRNALERAVVLASGDWIRVVHLPTDVLR